LISSLRATDIVARFGGEEFCILSNDLVLGEGILVFERIRKKCAEISLDTPKGPVSFTISIGLTGSIGESFDDMINTADKLLYEAKNSGKNKVVAQ
jgi:diguanylate cyclase (GGDEF)-like protein